MTTLVEIMRATFPSRDAAAVIVTTARALGFDVEVREIGACGVLVIVEGLRGARPIDATDAA